MSWRPVALSHDVPSGVVIGTRLDGRDLAIWRAPSGVVHVWDDRCPHRGMRLSLGFLRDGNLTCPYHGWRYDAAGRCTFIPAHPELDPPGSVAVERYFATEASGVIWTGGEPEDELPELGDLDPVRTVTIHAPADAVLDAIADWDATALVQTMDDTFTALHVLAPVGAAADDLVRLAEQAGEIRDSFWMVIG